ncbi:hypothetical protein ACMFMG_003762 [Clarireedia jacksonii]
MASYHRVLQIFGRSVEDKKLQCDCDIHPWEIRVNGKRWSGRIRLIGFIDVVFLISYSENSRFHDGIIIYKNDDIIEKLLKSAGKEPEDFNLMSKRSEPTNLESPSAEHKVKYITFSRDTADYTVNSVGHPIGLRTQYDKSELLKYEIHIRKPRDPLLKARYKRALKQHDTLDMVQDAMELGLVSYAEVLGKVMAHMYRGGSTLAMGKAYIGGLQSQQSWVGLSGDKV